MGIPKIFMNFLMFFQVMCSTRLRHTSSKQDPDDGNSNFAHWSYLNLSSTWKVCRARRRASKRFYCKFWNMGIHLALKPGNLLYSFFKPFRLFWGVCLRGSFGGGGMGSIWGFCLVSIESFWICWWYEASLEACLGCLITGAAKLPIWI